VQSVEAALMDTFIMVTRLDAEAASSPHALEQLEKKAMNRIRKECPSIEWPYDYVDIFRADGIETATKVSTLIRTLGHAHSEIWPATEWARFKELVHGL
jgi:hypothetical protein